MFSYVIMNPPYNDVNGTMLHYKFLCRALEVAETVVSIQPATWMNQQRNRAGLPLDGRGATINIIQDTEHLFGDSNTNLGYNLSVSVFSHKLKDVTVDWGTKDRTVYPNVESISMADRYGDKLRNIISKGGDGLKLSDGVYKSLSSHQTWKKSTDAASAVGKWIVRLTELIPNRERHPNNYGVMGIDLNNPVIFQCDGSYVPDTFCMFDTEQEARNCYAYLASDFVRAFIMAYKQGSHSRKAFFAIPWPATFDTDPALWANEAVSDRAGLSQEEREWLREMLPDCYHVR